MRLAGHLILSLALLAAVAAPQPRRATRRRRRNALPYGAPGTLEHFEAWARRAIRLDNGEPLELEEFQRKILRSYFDGATEILVLLPKGNGKTTLMAALALYHLCTYHEEAACYIAAASRDQAGIMFAQAEGMVRRSSALQARCRVFKGYREIRHKTNGGFIKVVAADADTADGAIPTLALVDELHRHKTTALYDVFRDGLGKRNGRLITISTAGSDEETPLGLMRRAARALPGLKRRGAYTYAENRAGTFVMHEWALELGDNLSDLRLVKRANPASFVTLEKLRDRRDSPSMTPHAWARFACNVWAQDDEAAISALDWNRVAGAELDPEPLVEDGHPWGLPLGAEVIAGVDLGWKRDTTAIMPVAILPERQPMAELEDAHELARKMIAAAGADEPSAMPPQRLVTVGRPLILEPPGDGRSLAEHLVFDAIAELAELYTLTVVIDPNADGQRFAQRLENELGITVVEHSQKPAPMSVACSRLSEAVRGRELEHGDDQALNAHVLVARAKMLTGEAWTLIKPRTRKPIDAAVALAMAVSTALATAEPAPTPFVIR